MEHGYDETPFARAVESLTAALPRKIETSDERRLGKNRYSGLAVR